MIQEKERIIDNLNTSHTNRRIIYIILISISITICIALIYVNFITKRKFKKKFEQLMNRSFSEPLKKQTSNTVKNIAILSNEITDKIEKGLSIFISEKEYLNKNISITSLAKGMDTNSKYLSQYINHYKEKKFTDYINELRIEYAIEKMKTDKKFRLYTIKAISEMVGFSNPVSFSQAFIKNTGIKPSYFVKKLQNTNNH